MVRVGALFITTPIFNMTMIPTVIKAAMVAPLTMLVMTNQRPFPCGSIECGYSEPSLSKPVLVVDGLAVMLLGPRIYRPIDRCSNGFRHRQCC